MLGIGTKCRTPLCSVMMRSMQPKTLEDHTYADIALHALDPNEIRDYRDIIMYNSNIVYNNHVHCYNGYYHGQ